MLCGSQLALCECDIRLKWLYMIACVFKKDQDVPFTLSTFNLNHASTLRHLPCLGVMVPLPPADGYTRNPTQIGRVYPIPDRYCAGYGISFKKNLGMGWVWVGYGIR
ncbi:hypothetical protein Hanom_Chr06g00524511 [Helianthus anomalus]